MRYEAKVKVHHNLEIRRLAILLLVVAVSSAIALPQRQGSAQPWTIPTGGHDVPPTPTLSISPTPNPPEYGSPGPKLGAQRWVVLLAEFSDVKHARTKDNVTRIVEGAAKYWRQTSYGKMWIEYQIYGWYDVPNTMSYYGKDLPGERDSRSDQLIKHAVEKANPDVDFSKFDYLIVIHAGGDQADSQNDPDQIWSSCYCGTFPRYNNPLVIKTNNGVFIRQAALVSEFDDFGTLAHESGHLLGLPDLYNRFSSSGDNYVGAWSLMASGTTNAVGLESWSRILLGWLTPTILSVQAKPDWYVLKPLEVDEGIRALKFPVDDKHYYLIELRLRMSSDVGIPMEGILVTSVDETKFSGTGILRVLSRVNTTRTLEDAAYAFKDIFSLSSVGLNFRVLASTTLGYAILVSSERAALDNVDPISITASPVPLARFLDRLQLEVFVKNPRSSVPIAGLQVLAEYNAPGIGWILIGTAITDSNGKATFAFQVLTRPGSYELRYSTLGGEMGGRILFGDVSRSTFDVKKGALDPSLELPASIGAYEELTIRIKLRDLRSDAIQNVTVRIFIDDTPEEMKLEQDSYVWRTTFGLFSLGSHEIRIEVLGAPLFENLIIMKTVSVQALGVPVIAGIVAIVGASIVVWRFRLPIFSGLRRLPAEIPKLSTKLKVLNRHHSCPNCGSRMIFGSKFCEECGTPLPVANPSFGPRAWIFCSECRSPIPRASKFCEVCGSHLAPL